MPYIKKEDRGFFKRIYDVEIPRTPGELNYLLSIIVTEYLGEEGISYDSINEVIGVLECAKMELYRRVAVPYEQEKMESNGDVYTS